MDKLVFKDWLAERGCLRAFILNRLADDDWDGASCPVEIYPSSWMGLAFKFSGVPEGYEYWENLRSDWRADYPRHDEVEMGMPINDKLGMALLLAELEEDHG